ncbi:hypothetical protein JG687_00017601 [Phytophthora cactorum]|uniref:Uncharacterized protein n=1 Tax=Phytophthora cactorum TaxID=29920 RepID=A0A8T1TS27_9STRA|nr:hypothetical protein JG687_00017601 [Phytophthora cactorum]
MLEVHQPPDAPFVRSPKFESAIVKVLEGKENRAAAISTWATGSCSCCRTGRPKLRRAHSQAAEGRRSPQYLHFAGCHPANVKRGGAAVQLGTCCLAPRAPPSLPHGARDDPISQG